MYEPRCGGIGISLEYVEICFGISSFMSRRAWIAIKKLMTKAIFIATITGLVTNESNNKSFA